MKRKTITSVLAKKHKDFVDSFPEALRPIVNEGTIITGGSIASMLMKEPINDFDYYFKTPEAAKAVVDYFLTAYNNTTKKPELHTAFSSEDGIIGIKIVGLKDSGYDEVPDDENADEEPAGEKTEQPEKPSEYKIKFVSDNAITLSNKIQLIFRFCGTPDEIHANFDFVHCTCSYDTLTKELKLPPRALESILARELTFMNSKFPLCAVIRTRKFIKRGWQINAGQYVKMALILNEMNLKDIRVLRQQLTGVDSVYFNRVINAIEKRAEEDPTYDINNEMLFEIIEKIFG